MFGTRKVNDMAGTALDFSGKEQLYYQLYDILFQDIINGVYSVGDLIPSESELMRLYGVSRATARKAMEMLANNGLINKRRGYGSEVVSSYPNTSPQHVTSYIKKNEVERAVAEKRMLVSEIVPAAGEIARELNLAEGTPVFRMKRVRYSGDKSFYLEINHFEQSYIPGAIDRDFSKESLRAFLNNSCQIHWSRASQEIYAVTADEEKAPLLQVPVGAPLLYIKRISFDMQNVPRECVMTYYRADLYHLEIELDA